MSTTKNVIMKQYNGTDYDIIYPACSSSQDTEGIYQVGDIKKTVRTLSRNWHLCDGTDCTGTTLANSGLLDSSMVSVNSSFPCGDKNYVIYEVNDSYAVAIDYIYSSNYRAIRYYNLSTQTYSSTTYTQKGYPECLVHLGNIFYWINRPSGSKWWYFQSFDAETGTTAQLRSQMTEITGTSCYSIKYLNNQWIMLTNTARDNAPYPECSVWHSSNFTSFTQQTTNAMEYCYPSNGIIYFDNKYIVSVASSTAYTLQLYSSTDLDTWTLETTITDPDGNFGTSTGYMELVNNTIYIINKTTRNLFSGTSLSNITLKTTLSNFSTPASPTTIQFKTNYIYTGGASVLHKYDYNGNLIETINSTTTSYTSPSFGGPGNNNLNDAGYFIDQFGAYSSTSLQKIQCLYPNIATEEQINTYIKF